MKSNGNFQFSVGGASILMIFVVLCLTTFGVLSYVTANADGRISAKNAEAVQNYYKANRQAQTKLEEVDSALAAAKSDAKQAVEEGTCDRLKNRPLYQSSPEVRPILTGGLPQTAKYAACYRIFSRLLLSKCPGVVIEAAREGDDALRCSFTADADQNRRIQVKLTINSYESAERYQIADERLIQTQENADGTGSEETLHLWQGNSGAP